MLNSTTIHELSELSFKFALSVFHMISTSPEFKKLMEELHDVCYGD